MHGSEKVAREQAGLVAQGQLGEDALSSLVGDPLVIENKRMPELAYEDGDALRGMWTKPSVVARYWPRRRVACDFWPTDNQGTTRGRTRDEQARGLAAKRREALERAGIAYISVHGSAAPTAGDLAASLARAASGTVTAEKPPESYVPQVMDRTKDMVSGSLVGSGKVGV